MRYEELTVGKLTQGNYPNPSLIAGTGSSANPEVSSQANKNFMGYWVKSKATTGTTRGLYFRMYLNSGAGGETVRAYTTVSNNAPADTCNGAHISLSFGASVGNITGEGQAVRGTLAIPSRSLGGTCAAVKAELWADGAGSTVANTAFIRCTLAGDGTGVTALQTAAKFMTIDGVGAAGNGKILQENGALASDHILKCSIDGVGYGIMLVAL